MHVHAMLRPGRRVDGARRLWHPSTHRSRDLSALPLRQFERSSAEWSGQLSNPESRLVRGVEWRGAGATPGGRVDAGGGGCDTHIGSLARPKRRGSRLVQDVTWRVGARRLVRRLSVRLDYFGSRAPFAADSAIRSATWVPEVIAARKARPRAKFRRPYSTPTGSPNRGALRAYPPMRRLGCSIPTSDVLGHLLRRRDARQDAPAVIDWR
jgi:hypothetical protein